MIVVCLKYIIMWTEYIVVELGVSIKFLSISVVIKEWFFDGNKVLRSGNDLQSSSNRKRGRYVTAQALLF